MPRPGWQPLGLAFDTEGNLYVTDLSGPFQKVLVIDRAATVVRTLGENEKLSFPNGVAVDGAGNVYVTDSNNGRLLVFDAEGTVRAQVGRGAGQGNLGLPRGLAVDGSGRVFVADTTGQGVFIYRAPQPTTAAASTSSGSSAARASRTASSSTPTASRSTRADACTWQTRSTTACRSGATEAPGRHDRGR